MKVNDNLSGRENSERTAGGLVGKIAGRTKEAVGSALGRDDLGREGRLQQAQVDAEAQAARAAAEANHHATEASLQAEKTEAQLEYDRLQNAVAAREREQRIEGERDDAERQAESQARREQAAAESQARRARIRS